MWTWWKDDETICFSKEQPERIEQDDFEKQLNRGDFKAPPVTLCVQAKLLNDIRMYLAPRGERRCVELHDLWGEAKDTTSYNKKLWIQIAGAVE